MIPYIAIEVIIVLVLIFFAWRGAKKGLILSLLGLAGLVVAFFGARFVSTTFHEPVADIIEPGIYQGIKEMEEDALRGIELEFDLESSVDGLVELLKEQELFPSLVELLETAIAEDGIPSSDGLSAAESLATYLATLAAKAGLFILSFLIILLLWFLISRALDLAFKLPILSTINTLGGLILGLAKAVVVVIVLVWVGQLVGLLPAHPTTPILSLFTLEGITDLLNKLVV